MWKTASILIGLVLILMTLGLVMLASTSGVRAQAELGQAGYYVVRQIIWIGFALIAGAVASRLDYHVWYRLAIPFGLFTLALLVMVLVPGVGLRIKGSSRWLPVGPFNLQPSEVAKIAVVVILAWWLKKNARRNEELVRGLLVPGAALGVFAVLILAGPDVGTTFLVALVGGALMLLGGTRPAFLAVAGVGALSGLTVVVMRDEVRMRRILAFLNPERYAQAEAYQLTNALYAFVVGGQWGAGFGRSLQKQFYLPEAHTDFIFAIIGEELGVLASMGVLALFLGLFACGMTITLRAPDPFGRLLAFGCTLMITMQALLNMGVVVGVMPTTGLALPFISYGGSNLVVSTVLVGILINVSLHAGGIVRDAETRAIKDRSHRW